MLNRNFGLDLIRVIGLWIVILQHAGVLLFGYKVGILAVEIFFVLSGFLIGKTLLRELKKINSIKTISRFILRRWFKTFPIYYLVIYYLYIFVSKDLDVLCYVFFLQNNVCGITFYPVTWSLAIEEWFYFIVPFFLSVILYVFKSDGKKISYCFVAFFVLEIIARLIHLYGKNIGYYGINGNVPFRFDSIFVGVFLAFIKDVYPVLYEKITSLRVFLFAIVFLFIHVVVFAITTHTANFPFLSYLYNTVGLFTTSLGMALMIPFSEGLKESKYIILNNYIKLISLMTYTVYLIHPIVYSYFLEKFGLIFSLLMVHIFSYLIYKLIEKPIMDLRERIPLTETKNIIFTK